MSFILEFLNEFKIFNGIVCFYFFLFFVFDLSLFIFVEFVFEYF